MKKIMLMFLGCVIMASCSSTKKIPYFQDAKQADIEKQIPVRPIRLQPEDKISILVNSRDPQLTNLFNLPYVTRQLGQTTGGSYSQGVSGYSIDTCGEIDFPVLGKLKVGGMTRSEIAAFIKDTLMAGNYVNDPIVTVEFMNLQVSMLGEVARPGRYNITQDKITILDALCMAGDMSIFGKRDNVMVLRNENGVQKTYTLNLCSVDDVLSSPVYYLQQNDVVYVEPNAMRTRQSTVNGNNVRSASFWMSMASVLTTVAIFCINYL
ncbi:MAG: polysaccharide biosynthesis/export family protein [Bacteroidales bacterium]|nr:polysaccharide biosynthesis/export family protein [Bacteroidales bacterium]